MSTYTELFSLSITHDYYTDGMCPDFSIEPTPECEEILEGHRIVAKNKIDGIQLVILVEDEVPLIDISTISKFRFYMKLNDTAFSNYTDLSSPSVNRDQMYYYHNQSVLLNRLHLETIEKSEVTLPLNDVSIFGIIDIYNNELAVYANKPSQYIINFTAGAILWKYYFITNQSSKGTMVSDDEITFIEEEPPTPPENTDDPIWLELKSKYPDNDIRLYYSGTPVKYQQEGRKGIAFTVLGEGSITWGDATTRDIDVLIENLPNPSIHDNGVKILKVTI